MKSARREEISGKEGVEKTEEICYNASLYFHTSGGEKREIAGKEKEKDCNIGLCDHIGGEHAVLFDPVAGHAV